MAFWAFALTAVDRDTVIAAARLARLAVNDDEIDAYRAHFERLLGFCADVTSAAIDDVEPMAHPLDQVQRLRADEVTQSETREALQQSAPAVDDGYYLGPRVIE